ncbi:MAG TPA: DUF2905 domain-containing protein [Victivallales bacterium]|nr:DUF2905 domain-containing protein [Victivallales bacterium]
MKSIGMTIIFFGVILVIIGIVFLFYNRIPFIGKLPGDISFKGKNSSFYFPVTTCIIISIILSVVLNLFFRIFKK